WAKNLEGYVGDYLDYETQFMVRAASDDPQKTLEDARQIFGEIQSLKRQNAPEGEFAFVTGVETERALQAKLRSLLACEVLGTVRVVGY
ncbi:MAG: hypothetical protein FWG82_02160, partial [Oscillospiraceae bacterium]|nr:hypothetical protein [Oscillospiraceae bacterium]